MINERENLQNMNDNFHGFNGIKITYTFFFLTLNIIEKQPVSFPASQDLNQRLGHFSHNYKHIRSLYIYI